MNLPVYLPIAWLPLLDRKLQEDKDLSVGFTIIVPESRSWWYLIKDLNEGKQEWINCKV